MKKLILFLLLLALLLPFTACAEEDSAELSLVATNFAAYDFAKEIVGRENARVSITFLASGDVHSFDPGFRDMERIERSDLFLYVGGESDAPIDKLLSNLPEVKTFRMIDHVTTLKESGSHGDDDHGDAALDEHIWTSPKNAISLVKALTDALVSLDPDYAENYRQNAEAYIASLAALDARFEALFKAQSKPIVVGDRFPLLYFADAYGMRYEAAFDGCHASSEPSPARVSELISLCRSEKIGYVFYIESGTHSVAERIASEVNAETLLFHSCHKVTSDEMEKGVSYLSLMEQNYLALEKAVS